MGCTDSVPVPSSNRRSYADHGMCWKPRSLAVKACVFALPRVCPSGSCSFFSWQQLLLLFILFLKSVRNGKVRVMLHEWCKWAVTTCPAIVVCVAPCLICHIEQTNWQIPRNFYSYVKFAWNEQKLLETGMQRQIHRWSMALYILFIRKHA